MRLAIVTIFGSILTLSLTACGALPDSGPAKAVGERYFSALKQAEYETIDTLYSAEFDVSTPKDKLQRVRTKIREKLGEYQSHRLFNTHSNRFSGLGKPAGDYTTLQYEVTYSKGTAKETIVVFAPRGGGDALINGYDVRWDLSLD